MADARLKSLVKDESGSVLIEATLVILTLISVIFGIVEFSYAFYQWNSATKAVQFGARTAAVSDPVSPEILNLTGLSNALPGQTYNVADQFIVTCTGKDTKCVCSQGCGTQTFSYSNAAMARILASMKRAFPRVTEANITIKYEYTGLGYAGRPGGPVPTITVSLTGMTFNFVLLSAFLPAGSAIKMPAFATTVTGEDLGTSGSS